MGADRRTAAGRRTCGALGRVPRRRPVLRAERVRAHAAHGAERRVRRLAGLRDPPRRPDRPRLLRRAGDRPRLLPRARRPGRGPPPADRRGAARPPQLPAGRGAPDPRLRRHARLPRGPAAVDAVGRGRLLRGAAVRRDRLPEAAAAVARRGGRGNRRAPGAGAAPGRHFHGRPPALAPADVRRRLRGGDGGRVALRARRHDSRLDGRARARGRRRRAVGIWRLNGRRGTARRAPVAVVGRGNARRVRGAGSDRRRGERQVGPTTRPRAGSARSRSASSSSTSWSCSSA